jgi:hypothetical protein
MKERHEFLHERDRNDIATKNPAPKSRASLLKTDRSDKDSEPRHEPFTFLLVSIFLGHVMFDVPHAVNAPPMCRYSRGAISEQ